MTLLNIAYSVSGYLNEATPAVAFLTFAYRAVLTIFYVINLDALICLVFRRAKLKACIKNLLLFISLLIFTCELLTLYYYHSCINSAMIYIMLGTAEYEVKEYFDVYIANYEFIKYILLVATVIIAVRFIYGFISRFKIFWSLILIAVLISFARSVYYRTILEFYHMSIIRMPIMLYDIYIDSIEFEKIVSGARQNIVLTRNESSIPYVVFILGESTGRNHMSLYGYKLDTSPRLRRRENLYVFTDTVSPHSHTIPVMEKLFTFYRYNSEGRWFTYVNLFNILNAAGYKTFWLSNQEGFGIYSTAGRFYAKQGGLSEFAAAWSSEKEMRNYDEILLPILDKTLLNSENSKNFYVLHLMGTHSRYDFRYPYGSEFEKFSYKDEDGFKGISDSQRGIRAQYDNAVLYNDFVVDEIIKRFENKNAIVIYVSDHGEEVYDVRDMLSHDEQNVSRYMIEIPFLIWTSNKFIDTYPDLCQRIAVSVNKPFMTDDMIHVILDIMQIETKDYDASKSIINDKFDMSRQRICSGKVYHKETGI